MTWEDFNDEVLAFLDVDARRRGIEAFRAVVQKAALADLGAYIDEYNTGKLTYSDDELTPFDTETAEAVSEYLKSRIARNIHRDVQLSQVHMAAYMNLRRRLYVRLREGRTPELTPFIGKAFTVILNLRNGRLPQPIIGNVWFTVKRYRGEPDADAIVALQRGDGIEILNDEDSQIRVTMTAEQTDLLSVLDEYYWDVQVEDTNHQPVFPLLGKMKPRQPVTDTFAATIMLISGEPLLTIAGVPISLIP